MIEIFNSSNIPDTNREKELLDIYEKNIPLEFYSQTEKEKWLSERSILADFLAVQSNNEKIQNFQDAPRHIIASIDDSSNKISGILEYTYFKDTEPEANVIFISWLLVGSLYRWKWIDSKLFEKYLKLNNSLMESWEYEFHKLWVDIDNPAINLYKKWGYEYFSEWLDKSKISMLKRI